MVPLTSVVSNLDGKQVLRLNHAPGLVEINNMNVTVRPAFNSLAKQFASINTTGLQPGAITTANSPIPCTPFSYLDGFNIKNDSWTIGPGMPAKPNVKLCRCMMRSLDCVKNPTLPIETAVSRRLQLCNQNRKWCESIYGDRHKGVYHAYLLCNSTERVSWVVNQFYLAYNHDESACSGGGGVIQQPTPMDRMPEVCRTLLTQAGPDGMGNVTYNPYPLGADINLPLLREAEHGGGSGATWAAIGVGVAAALAFAALFAWLYLRRRRRRRREAEVTSTTTDGDAQTSSSDPAAGPAEAEQTVAEIDPGRGLLELDEAGANVHELGQGERPAELSATRQIERLVELDTPAELSNRLKARRKEMEAYGGYDRWLRAKG
jgi:X8 domain